jgi:L-glyceraldehyde 3-phosphate reductase
MSKAHFLKPEMLTDDLLLKLNRWNNIAADRGETLAEMALAWILQQQGVTSVLVGASSTAQLQKNLKGITAAPLKIEEL